MLTVIFVKPLERVFRINSPQRALLRVDFVTLVFNERTGLIETGNSSILIIGNGPSTRELVEYGLFNLPSHLDTFGMGIAYRYFRQVNWWPTFYALCDKKVAFSHRKDLAKLLTDLAIPTLRFYFSFPVSNHPRLELIPHSSTGDFCFKQSIEMGYKEIYLIGIEGHYVEEIAESRPLSSEEFYKLGFDRLELPEAHRKTLRIITKTPKDNPNYFFNNYQNEGDVYSLPQSKRHLERWSDVSELGEANGIKVVNLSEESKIEIFVKSSLSSVFDYHTERFMGRESELLPDPNNRHIEDRSENGPTNISPAYSAQHKTQVGSSFFYGPFDRVSAKRIDEVKVVSELFKTGKIPFSSQVPIMIDVGACKGSAFRDFAEREWDVHAFEPNPPLFQDLRNKFPESNVRINSFAVSDVEGDSVPFYTSEESIGISTLRPFRATHKRTAEVNTIRLDRYLRENRIGHVDFLKIDAEGFDLKVLQGLDLEKQRPSVILCEFEDSKTEPIGYKANDLAKYLIRFGYTVYLSEWHPIIRYGTRHDWRGLKRYPCDLEDPDAWGNFLAFKADPGVEVITKAVDTVQNMNERQAESRINRQAIPTGLAHTRADSGRELAIRAEFGEWIRSRSLTLFLIGQFILWCIRAISRHPIRLAIPLLAAGFIFMASVQIPMMEPVRGALVVLGGGIVTLILFGLIVSFTNSKFDNFIAAQEARRRDQRLKYNDMLKTSLKGLEISLRREWRSQLKAQNEKFTEHRQEATHQIDELVEIVEKAQRADDASLSDVANSREEISRLRERLTRVEQQLATLRQTTPQETK